MKLNKFFKILMVVLILLSVGILVWGFTGSWTDQAVEILLKWTYVMVGLAIAAALLIGLIISTKNDPKSLIKLCIGLIGIAAVCFGVYAMSKGAPAIGLTTEQPEVGTLKITDTILNLTYLTAGLAIVSIVVGEIISAIRNK